MTPEGNVYFSANSSTTLLVNRNDSGRIVAFRFNGNTSEAGGISVTGAQTSVYSCGQNSVAAGFISDSDYRLKENIQDLPSATAAVKLLKPKSFNYIGKSETVQGFIAHELQEVNSFYATGTKDEEEAIGIFADYDGTILESEVTKPTDLEYTEETTDEEGVTTQTIRTRTWTATGTRPVYQGVDQTKLIPLLTKALQECLERIEQLESRLAALENS